MASAEQTRVVLAHYPTMIPDAVRELVAEQPDMEIVGDCRGPMRILQEVGRSKADVVILMQAGAAEPGLCSQLLSVYPDLTIIGLTPELKVAFIQQLCSRRRELISAQSDQIVEILRTAVREPWGGEGT